MAEDEIAKDDSGDDVARLVALTERQHELWNLLRDAVDERLRNDLFDELTSNREELTRLKDRVSAQVDRPVASQAAVPAEPQEEQSRSVGEELRSKILTPPEQIAPSQPPPPPSPPPAPTPPPPEPAASAPDHIQAGDSPDRLQPEETPYRSREADLAATRQEEPVSVPRPTPPSDQPRPVADGVLEERRRSAHSAYQEIERVRPRHERSFPIFAILVAVAAVAVVAWYVLFLDRGDGGAASPGTTTTSAAFVAAPNPSDQIEAVIEGLDVGTIMVDERDGVLYLIGSVESEADRNAVIGASRALAGDFAIDDSGLVLNAAEEDVRAAALQAIADAGFDRINVSVAGGIATLTGVTPDEGTSDLVAAVSSVAGIAQVVDLTESSDRAAALDGELDRVIAVTPIVFASGQVDLNALQERILDSAAEIILAYNGPIVTIIGYTDASGTTAENEQISILRGERVRDYLIAQGVPAERLEVEGRGESDSSGSIAVAGLERRVEFEVGYAVSIGSEADFRIGIVAPSARDDLAFTQSIVDAANVIAAERGGVGVDVSDGLFVPEDAEAAIRAYAADGYDLVIAHGSQYGTSLASIAPEFPNTAFAWGTAADTFDLPNVSSYEVAANEGGYVMGVIAALLTESDVVGVVGPLEVGDAKLFVDGFRTGVTATDSGISVLTTYTGSFSDVGLAAEAATSHVNAGADVLTGSAQMVVGAVGVAAESDAVWFGTQSDQAALAPDLVVASQVYHWEVALRQILTGLDQGILGGQAYTLTLANGGLVIEYNSGFSLSAATVAIADEVTADIISGTVITGG